MLLRNKTEVKPCEVDLEIEVGADEVVRAMDQAYKEFSEVTSIPGFRKGKAPRHLVARYVSEDRVKKVAAEMLLPEALASAVEEAGLEPFGDPDLEIVQFEDKSPFIFKASIALVPKTELGDYVGIEADRMVHVVSDDEVQEEIDKLRDRTATYEVVEGRPVQEGDRIFVELLDLSDPDDTPDARTVTVGDNLPSLDEGLVGMTQNEEKEIQAVYPEDFPNAELAGTSKPIRAKVLEIREKRLPDETDEWAKTVAEKLDKPIESAEGLRAEVKSELERAAATLADRQTESKIVMRIIDNSNVCYPEMMREHEVHHRMEELTKELERFGSNLDEYLERTGKTSEQVHEEMEQAADRDLKVMLVLTEISHKENISVEESETEREIERLAKERGVPVESFMAYLDKTETRDSISERLLRRKVLDFLVHASNIQNVGQAS